MHKGPKSKKISVHLPQGFVFAAGQGGLRTHGKGPDVGLIYSTVPARAAAVFTANRVKAAPVLLSQQHLRRGRHIAQAIVVNAGNANCATGPAGMQSARQCAATAAKLFSIPQEHVLIASTGVIGVPLDSSQITKLLPKLSKSMEPQLYDAVSRAILTTDTRPKVVSRQVKISGSEVNILGMAKGSGMIHPRLATMLGFLFTDAAVDAAFLREALKIACELSFNRISVDGDTSTNDTVFLLANGLAGNAAVKARSRDAAIFVGALAEVAQQLAIEIVKDGEGARRLVEIRVRGASSDEEAFIIARSIGLSSLVKTAIAGADPNWGRILSAAGNAGVPFDPDLAEIRLDNVLVCRKGQAAKYNEPALKRKLESKEVLIELVLREGDGQARFWTCDFTEEYIRINASYRT